MKKYTIILMICLLSTASFGQNNLWEKAVIHRIYFQEKMNLPLKQLPSMLLKAWCEGELLAYYPKETSTVVTYNEFLDHFGFGHQDLATSVDPGKSAELIPCQENLCLQLDPWLLNCMSMHLDVVESRRFDKIRSQFFYDIQYVRVVFSAECSANGLEYYGPLFHYKDLLSLPTDKYWVMNPANSAANYTLQQVLALRLFTSIDIGDTGNYYDNPAKEGTKSREEMVEKEVEVWEY